MLGPGDISDWGYDEAYQLRASIRSLPVYQRFLNEPYDVSSVMGDQLLNQLMDFSQSGDLPLLSLRALFDDASRFS